MTHQPLKTSEILPVANKPNGLLNALARLHGTTVSNRRITKLGEHLSKTLPMHAKVLDVGCGDGVLAGLMEKFRPDISIQGIDVLIRPQTQIPVTEFNGEEIPFADNEFDAVMFVDVLHHTDDPLVLLREAARTAKKCIIIKDHTDEGWFSNQTLSFMDWVGNKPHGVRLPYNYWTLAQWNDAFKKLNLKVESWEKDLKIYPRPADFIFGRSLHFVAKLSENANYRSDS